jgi:large subunit ribosomal protein L20
MARVKRGMAAHARHRKVLSLAKGFRGRSSTCFRPALERLEKSWQYAYRDRRTKKRNMRALWIQRINAAVRQLGSKYSTFVNGLAKKNISVDRKTLAKFAMEDPALFKDLVALAVGPCGETAADDGSIGKTIEAMVASGLTTPTSGPDDDDQPQPPSRDPVEAENTVEAPRSIHERLKGEEE